MIRAKSKEGDIYLDMAHLLVLLLLWGSGIQAEGKRSSTEPDDVRLVGGASRCAGTLEVKHLGEWRPVCASHDSWTLKEAGVFCDLLDCGPAVSIEEAESSRTSAWLIRPDCVLSRSPLRDCATTDYAYKILNLTCSAPTDFTVLITMLVLPLTLLLLITALYFYCQAYRWQKSSRRDNTELVGCNQGVCAAEGGPAAKKGAQEDLQGGHPTST